MNEANPSTPFKSIDPLCRFSERVDDYAKYRPSYPAAAIDTILKEFCGSPSPLTAADIGAGTDIASRQLADRGVYVLLEGG